MQRKEPDPSAPISGSASGPSLTLRTFSRLRIAVPLGAAVLVGALGPQPVQDWCIAVFGVIVCQLIAARAAAFIDLTAGLWRPQLGSYARAAAGLLTALILLSVGDAVHSDGVKLAALALLLTALVWPFAERAIIRNTGYVRSKTSGAPGAPPQD